MINLDRFFKLLGLIAFLTIIIDFVWITFIMKTEYNKMIPDIQNDSMIVRLLPAILSYTTIVLSIMLFSIPKISIESRLADSLLFGGLLGLLMYGMFSFTNYALIDKWSIKVLLLDTFWGFILYTIVTYLASFFYV